MSKELIFLFPASHCDPALPLPSSVSPNLFPIFTLTFWTTSLFFLPICKLSPFIHHVLWPQLFCTSIFYSSPSLFYSPITPTPPPWLKLPALSRLVKHTGLSWSASGFTVSSSANIIRAICVHTRTYKHSKQISPSLRQTATSDGLFPFRGLCLEIYITIPLQPPPSSLSPPCPTISLWMILYKLSNH